MMLSALYMLNNIMAVCNNVNSNSNKNYSPTLKENCFFLQPGMPIFLVWAYHPTVDAQPMSSFPQHPNDARGVMQQTLIPAAITTTPTPGRTVHSRKEKKKKFDE